MEKKKEDVGNYFVSNYPPYSFWKRDFVDQAESMLNKPAKYPTSVGMYLHIPFCRKRCKFCYFKVYTDKNKREREIYLDALKKEITTYRQLAVLQGRDLQFIYVGGGTPSALDAKQIQSLGQTLRETYSWEKIEEVTFECEPGTLTEDKLKVIKEFGVTRLSLGVENFSAHILEENGRAHRSDEIYRAYDWAKALDFPQINIDLIAGMLGETEENWKDCVEKTLLFRPDSVTIYQMELPFNTVYAQALQDGKGLSFTDWPTKRRWVEEAFTRLVEAGYEQSSAYTVRLPGQKNSFVYRDALWHGADMIGTGVSSFSHVQGVHYQNVDRFDEYLKKCQSEEIPIGRALPISDRESLIREMILQLKLGRIQKSYFREKYTVDIGEEFSEAYHNLESDGMLQQNPEEIVLTSQGLLRVDSLLPNFYQPEHQNARYT